MTVAAQLIPPGLGWVFHKTNDEVNEAQIVADAYEKRRLVVYDVSVRAKK
jgi:hypothetical protein